MTRAHWIGLLAVASCTLAAGCGGEDENVFGGTATQGTSAGGANSGGGNTGAGSSSGGAGATGASSSGGAGQGGGTSNGGGSAGGGGPGKCGDFVCDAAECAGNLCPPDCGVMCGPSCGDGTCNNGETCMTCPADCEKGCGDGCCLIGENCAICPADCKTPESCDPSACGNMQCNYGLGETCLNCADCFGLCDCGDFQCVAPETAQNCPWDCGGG